MKNNYILYSVLLSVFSTIPYNAMADMVDYGSLQSLFGEPVTTSATGTPQRVSDVAANMTIITTDEIRQSGSRNIPEIIGKYVPGMDVFQSGLNSFDVGVRGYQQPFQPRLLVLVDGRQVFIDDYSRTIWDNILVNKNDIRQIEVVKGASSALFGSNAAGGVVNIITFNPVYDNNNVASIGYGTQNQSRADVTVTKKIGEHSGVKISVGTMDANEFKTDYRTTDLKIFDPMHRYVAQSSNLQINPDLQANTELTYSTSNQNPQQPGLNGRSAESADSYSIKGGFNWQTKYGLFTNNNYFYSSETEGHVTGLAYPEKTVLYVSQLQDEFKLNKSNTLRIAVEYRHKDFDYNFAQPIPQEPAFSQDVFSPSGMWLWQINDKLSWTNAARLDYQSQESTGSLFTDSFYKDADYKQTITAISANSGMVYKATTLDTLRATYGRGIQMPSFIEGNDNLTTLVAANTYADIEGNPYLKPTIVENYELGYDRQLPIIYSTAKVSTFYEINHDIIGFIADQGSKVRVIGGNTYLLYQSLNKGDSSSIGGELSLKGAHPNGMRWGASYSYAGVKDSLGVSRILGYDGSTPAHHFRISTGYTTGPWELDVSGHAVTDLHMQYTAGTKITTDGYYALSSRVGYKINKNFTAALSGSNITQARTTESPFPAIERQVYMSLTGRF